MTFERISFLLKRGIIPALILVVALDLRTAGLFRGLSEGKDSIRCAKQMNQLGWYLKACTRRTMEAIFSMRLSYGLTVLTNVLSA